MRDYTKLPRDIADCMKRAGAELSEDQYMLLAGYLAQTQSELTAAKAENEALRGRVSDLEVALDCQLQAFEQSEAEILRKQAEAVDLMCAEWREEAQWIINESHANYQRHYAKAGFQYAQRLRQQAEAAGKGGDDDKP